jgi:hypothetical protein
MRMVKAIQERKWPLTHKGRMLLLGLANYYHHFIQDFLFSKVATTLPDLLEKNDYPKSGMSFVTRPLASLRASCFCCPCSSSRNLMNLMRCIRANNFVLAEC